MENQRLLSLVQLSVPIGQNRSSRFEPVRGQPQEQGIQLVLCQTTAKTSMFEGVVMPFEMTKIAVDSNYSDPFPTELL